MKLGWLLALVLAVSGFGAAAAEADPSVQEMIDALAPKPAMPLTRGLSRGGKPAPQVREGRLQLSVQFDYASATITPESRDLLARLSAAMGNPALAQLRYRIEGHTDASGDPVRNQGLSERRAAAVAKFLGTSSGVQTVRMNTVGLGSSVPANDKNPKAAENRRVVIVSLEAGEVVAKQEPGSGTVQDMKGSLHVRRGGETRTLRTGSRVSEADVLTTPAASTALLKMDDGANLLIRPDTTIELRKLQKDGEPGSLTQVYELIVGAFRYVSSPTSKRTESIAFVTSTATLGLRGTDFDIVHRPQSTAAQDPGTYVKVNRGAVSLGGLDGSMVDVAVDQQAYAGKPGLSRGGKSQPAALRIEPAADVFKTGDLDSLLPR